MSKAYEILSKMKDSGLDPDASLYNTLISGHGKIGNKKEAIKFYCEMVTKGLVPKTSTYNVLIEDFAKVGKMDQARELLNEMQVRRVPPNSSTYDILICGWCNLSKQPELDRISKKTYRTEARTLFAEMNEKGFVPCENTLACISSTFARPGMVVDAKHMLKDMYKRKQS
jgi:pentatricopeptide repeat protein